MTIVAISRQAWQVMHQGITRFGQTIEQGGLADVGAPNNDDSRFHDERLNNKLQKRLFNFQGLQATVAGLHKQAGFQ